MRVNTVEEREAIELDDDFASLVGDYDALAELKESIKDDLRTRKQQEVDRELIPQIIDRVLEEVVLVKWPVALEDQEVERALEQRKQELDREGLDLQTHLQTRQQTEEDLREELREAVQNSIKTSLVLGKVAEVEDLQIEPEELRRQAELMAMFAGGNKDVAESFTSPAGLQMLASNLLLDRARERLLAIAKGEAEEAVAEAEEAVAEAEEAVAEAEEAVVEAEETVDIAAEVEEVEAEAADLVKPGDVITAEAEVVEDVTAEVVEAEDEAADLVKPEDVITVEADAVDDSPAATDQEES